MEEKHIIIIGASSGIGLNATIQFATMGWKIGIAARRIDKLISLQQQFPHNIIAIEQIDITHNDANTKLLSLIDKIGGLDTLLLASGIGSQNLDLDLSIECDTVSTNVLGFTRIVDTTFNYFRKRPSNIPPGQIAVISSIAGTMGLGIAPSYSATKRYQRHYIDALEQLAHFEKVNVRFTDIRPGFVDTPLLNNCRKFPMLMNLDYASKRIIKAIIQKKRVAIIDWRWKIVVMFWHLIPKFIWRKFPAR